MTAYARASLEEKRRALVMLGIALGQPSAPESSGRLACFS